MKLKRITVINHLTGWNVRDLFFDDYLTLLVGASGVGKTLILRVIKNISNIANGGSYNGLEWDITFEDSGNTYQWTGKFDTADDSSSYFRRDKQEYPIICESLRRGDNLIISRENDQIMFNDKQTVKLDTAKSAIALLKEEDEIKPVFKAFHQVFELENYNDGIRLSPFLSTKRDEIKELNEVHNNRYLSPIEKLFILRRQGLPQFEKIKELFMGIFTNIEDIDFSLEPLFNDTMYPVLKIKEKWVDAWIMQDSISSGMFRTLSQITFLVLAQDGDIILIDEFENGLGVNCIDQLADQILDADQDIQVIITSHHPYIINSIPFQKWKVVTRNRCNLKVLTAADLKIGEHSKHDAFMQLVQTNAYRKGVE
ncbi:MAG: hypothetical protein BHV77_06685 [Bacteroides sp. 43_108]|nr:MAG: hypothetical protein BHV77_06685 [Bacteroides sp. 43_108]